MKTNGQKMLESVLDAVFIRRSLSELSNAHLAEVYDVSIATIANRARALSDSIRDIEFEYNKEINDERFLLKNLDRDIILFVLDQSRAGLMITARDAATREQLSRIIVKRNEQFNKDKLLVKELGIV